MRLTRLLTAGNQAHRSVKIKRTANGLVDWSGVSLYREVISVESRTKLMDVGRRIRRAIVETHPSSSTALKSPTPVG